MQTLSNEQRRLEILRSYEILDTAPEVIFDELARMAASICETPIALVSLIDMDRQWLKAHFGAQAGQTPRDLTFCTHAIEQTEPFVVSDASKDDRFKDNPFVSAEGGIGFYAGAPLISKEGVTLGTLCVVDTRARELSPEKLDALCMLARHVVSQLELRRQLKKISYANTEQTRELRRVVIEQQERIERLSHYNSQTGLANRELFLKRVSKELTDALRRGVVSALFVVEVQRFDMLSEALGPHGMDGLLNEIALRLQQCAEDNHVLAHVRDERFAILRRSVVGATQAALFVENELLAQLDKSYLIHGTEVRPNFKVGIALSPTDSTEADVLLRSAKTALATAVGSRAPMAFCSIESATRVAGALTLETKLRRAFERGEFRLHYQPKIDLRTSRLTGVEALLRWADPDAKARQSDGRRPLVPPGRFVPILEEIGLIVPVGMWVLKQAAIDFLDWKRRGIAVPRVAVNVSTLQLQEAGFVGEVAALLRSYESPTLDLEITEGLFLEHQGPCVDRLRELRKQGIRIAIDDFGTGYSSLKYLAELPIDVLKIDRSFVKAMTRRPEDMAIVSSVISLAQGLRFTTVAEGVETAEQKNMLRLLRCDEMQGFLYSRALSKSELEGLVSGQERGIDLPGRCGNG